MILIKHTWSWWSYLALYFYILKINDGAVLKKSHGEAESKNPLLFAPLYCIHSKTPIPSVTY